MQARYRIQAYPEICSHCSDTTLAAALGDDPNFASTVTNGLAGKLAAASNLADLPNKATARSNLGLGSLAIQTANAVAITGGSIDGIVLDGGTF